MDAWQPLLDRARVDHDLLLPILVYRDPSGQPMLGPPRDGPGAEEFLRTAEFNSIPRKPDGGGRALMPCPVDCAMTNERRGVE
jgi:hypothetical protein